MRQVVLLGWGLMFVGCVGDVGDLGSLGGHASEIRDLDSVEAEFLDLLNEHRANHGAPPVRADRFLNDGAYDYAGLMGRRNHFDHTGPDGSSPWDRMCAGGYDPACGPSTAVGENIAAGQQTAAEVFTAWRNSPGHNRNMLNPAFRVVGIGRHEVPGSRFRVYWVNVFGGQPTSETVDPSAPPEPPMSAPEPPSSEPPASEPPAVEPPPMMEPMEMEPEEMPGLEPNEPGFQPGYELHGSCAVTAMQSGGSDPEPWLAVVVGSLLLARRRRS